MVSPREEIAIMIIKLRARKVYRSTKTVRDKMYRIE